MKICAFDLSLTATGYACTTGTDGDSTTECGSIRPPLKMREGPRLSWIIDTLETATGMYTADIIVIEDIPMHAKSAGLTAQLHGALKLALHDNGGRTPILIPPSTLKVIATGKGNSDKTAMVVAARERLGYDGLDNNVADARWLLELGLHLVGHRWATPLPQIHLRALTKIVWP